MLDEVFRKDNEARVAIGNADSIAIGATGVRSEGWETGNEVARSKMEPHTQKAIDPSTKRFCVAIAQLLPQRSTRAG